jgi:hypothetical protein
VAAIARRDQMREKKKGGGRATLVSFDGGHRFVPRCFDHLLCYRTSR